MEEQQVIKIIISFVYPLVMGGLGFFISRLMKEHDKQGEKIGEIEKTYLKKESYEAKEKELKAEINEDIKEQSACLKDDIKTLKSEFNTANDKTAKSIEALTKNVQDIQLNYINKEEFFRQNLALSDKIDKLTDMLIESGKTLKTFK